MGGVCKLVVLMARWRERIGSALDEITLCKIDRGSHDLFELL